jgi:hypothetical protein
MDTTFGQVQVDDICDGSEIITVETFAGGEWSFTRLTTRDGGRRTESSDHPVTLQEHADPLLVTLTDEDLMGGARYFADRADTIGGYREGLIGLHGIAREMNRRLCA